jgi:hypothetical protein
MVSMDAVEVDVRVLTGSWRYRGRLRQAILAAIKRCLQPSHVCLVANGMPAIGELQGNCGEFVSAQGSKLRFEFEKI